MNYASFVWRCFRESFWWHQRLLLRKGGELLLHRDGSLHWPPTPVPTPTLQVRARPLSPDLLVRSLCEVRCVLLFVWNGEIVCISKVHPLRKMVRESKFIFGTTGFLFSNLSVFSNLPQKAAPQHLLMNSQLKCQTGVKYYFSGLCFYMPTCALLRPGTCGEWGNKKSFESKVMASNHSPDSQQLGHLSFSLYSF